MYYVITFHESDGNDCTVFDAVVNAESEDDALSALSDSVESNDAGLEPDGSEFGYFFSCTDECEQDCEGHGGLVLRDVAAYDTESAAIEAIPHYHSRYFVT